MGDESTGQQTAQVPKEPSVKYSHLILTTAVVLVVSACGAETSTETPSTVTAAPAEPASADVSTSTVAATGSQQGVGPSSAGMQERHRATIPTEYAGLTNPIAADDESVARGAEAYAVCAACHGDGGLGDGTAGAALDPAPANIALTSQMMGDDYLFWRITEGGAQFETLMPAWGTALDETTRWDLINYMRALGAGMAPPGRGMGGGQGPGAAARATEQDALLAIAVDQGVITQDESDVFAAAHETVDARVAELRAANPGGGVDTLLPEALADLVGSGDLTQSQADTFLSVRNRLSEAGLLP